MNNYRNNASFAAADTRRSPHRPVSGAIDPAATANLAEASRRASAQDVSSTDKGRSSHSRRGARKGAPERTAGARTARSGASPQGASRQRRASAGASVAAAKGTERDTTKAAAKGSGRSRSGFMKYASDNRFVRAIYYITCGPFKPLFIAVLVFAVGVGLYGPVRDYYIAYRAGDILSRQLQVREQYNKNAQEEVDRYLSPQGIEDTARGLGMVLPGETPVNVTGLDDGAQKTDASNAGAQDTKDKDSSADAKRKQDDGADGAASDGKAPKQDTAAHEPSKDGPTTSMEVEEAEEAAVKEAPWYIKMLDSVFFFDPAGKQEVASSGSK